MVKPEWGTKRTCPNCGTRFYDLNKDEPVTCIECGEEWSPEPVLKSKQPILAEEESKKKKDAEADSDLGGDDDEDDLDIDIDEDGDSPDNEVDLGGDDDLGVETKSKGDDDDAEEGGTPGTAATEREAASLMSTPEAPQAAPAMPPLSRKTPNSLPDGEAPALAAEEEEELLGGRVPWLALVAGTGLVGAAVMLALYLFGVFG